ncbi:MAG: GAF domain-containing protein, partial [Anaerolineae bacterium]|nr:GAF domain-containing protein [Anaerolineae bacterium]
GRQQPGWTRTAPGLNCTFSDQHLVPGRPSGILPVHKVYRWGATMRPGQEGTTTDGRDRKLAAIAEMAKTVAAQSDPDTMLTGFLRSLIHTSEAADAAVLLLYDAPSNRLVVSASYGYEPDVVRQICLAPGESMSGRAFATGEPQLYSTPEAVAGAMQGMTPENRALFERAAAGLGHSRSAVCVPLSTARARVGVLVLENLRREATFDQQDLEFLRHAADIIALAIENHRLRAELENARAISEANRLKAEVISILAHEMRTPLTSIKGYASALLMEDASFDAAQQREFLEIIEEECDLMEDLIHDLLESSIIDAGLLRIQPEPVLLPRLVRSVIDEIEHRTRKHRFLADLPADLPLVEADRHRIAQVLRNLLDNAVKYSPDGGLIVVRAAVEGREVVVSVADQGVGIAPEHLNRLFEKFYRVRTGLEHRVVGSGLGLPIARAIVESHGGRIWAESQVGQGSTFYFSLPIGPSGVRNAEQEDG